MRKVIIVGEEPKEEKALKPIEFTDYLSNDIGWTTEKGTIDGYNKIVYLGKCKVDGDMFAGYRENRILIFKGHLNDGVY